MTDSKDTPVRIVAIGAGNRAGKYLHYIYNNPDKAQLVGVVEVNDLRREKIGKMMSLRPENCFRSADDFFKAGIEADAVMVCSPDATHYYMCMSALRNGYSVLLEKPIARTNEECDEIAAEAKKRGLIVAVCHVLRYHPYFSKLKELVDSGRLGKLISIDHRASVGIDRTAHSYVRGIWNREETTNPMILSKCCHDIDFLVWLSGSKCSHLSSYGSRSWFREENAPEGSALRCINCSVERGCPYSAVALYRDRHEWITNFDVPEGKTIDDVIEEELASGQYGKCVYHCDNNVVDHQVVAMEMENGVTVSLSMDCFTLHDDRKTHVCLSHGEIYGNEKQIEVYHFSNGEREVYDFSEDHSTPFHAGADLKLVEDFINALAGREHYLLTGIEDSMESHKICFAAEHYRHSLRQQDRE